MAAETKPAQCVVCGLSIRVGVGVVASSCDLILNYSCSSITEFLVRFRVLPTGSTDGRSDDGRDGDDFLCSGCLTLVTLCDQWEHALSTGIGTLQQRFASKSSHEEPSPLVDEDLREVDPEVLSPMKSAGSSSAVEYPVATKADASDPPLPWDSLDSPEFRERAPPENHDYEQFENTSHDEVDTQSVSVVGGEIEEKMKTGNSSRNSKEINRKRKRLLPKTEVRENLTESEPCEKRAKNSRSKRIKSSKGEEVDISCNSADEGAEDETKNEDSLSMKLLKMCGHCQIPLADLGDQTYAEHHRTAHPGTIYKKALYVEPLSCSVCSFKTRVKDVLLKHEGAVHGVGPGIPCHKCRYCGERFRYRGNLVKHLDVAHDRSRSYTCDECGYETRNAANFYSHKKTKHPKKIEKCICDHCGVELFAHLAKQHFYNNHHEKLRRTHSCPHCPVTFKSAKSLKAHLTKVHEIGDFKRKSFEGMCPECDKVIRSKDSFFQHVFVQHGIELPGLKKLPCSYCDEIFYSRLTLRSHVMIHTGVKAYQCSDCDYSTRFTGNLVKHRANVHRKKKTSS